MVASAKEPDRQDNSKLARHDINTCRCECAPLFKKDDFARRLVMPELRD